MGLDNPLHIVILVVILLLIFGAKRIPEIGRSLGTGMREFKQSVTGEHHQAQTHGTLAPETTQPAPPPAQAAAPGPPPAAPVAAPAQPVAAPAVAPVQPVAEPQAAPAQPEQ